MMNKGLQVRDRVPELKVSNTNFQKIFTPLYPGVTYMVRDNTPERTLSEVFGMLQEAVQYATLVADHQKESR